MALPLCSYPRGADDVFVGLGALPDPPPNSPRTGKPCPNDRAAQRRALPPRGGPRVYQFKDGNGKTLALVELFGAPDPTPLWNILDLTRAGRGSDGYPKLAEPTAA